MSSKIVDGILKDLKALPKSLKKKYAKVDVKRMLRMNIPYILAGYFGDIVSREYRISTGETVWDKLSQTLGGLGEAMSKPFPSFYPKDILFGIICGIALKFFISPIVK